MKPSPLHTLAAWSMLSLTCTAWAQLPAIPENVKTSVRQRVDYGYAPAVVVALMNTNGSAYFSYGSTDLDDGQPVDENTLFEIGSVTKVFTATLLADFAERGQLELTNAIQSYLPPGIQAPTRSGRSITLTLAGDTDRDYVIQTSTNLTGWSNLSTNTIWDSPIPDRELPSASRRFYRVLEP